MREREAVKGALALVLSNVLALENEQHGLSRRERDDDELGGRSSKRLDGELERDAAVLAFAKRDRSASGYGQRVPHGQIA